MFRSQEPDLTRSAPAPIMGTGHPHIRSRSRHDQTEKILETPNNSEVSLSSSARSVSLRQQLKPLLPRREAKTRPIKKEKAKQYQDCPVRGRHAADARLFKPRAGPHEVGIKLPSQVQAIRFIRSSATTKQKNSGSYNNPDADGAGAGTSQSATAANNAASTASPDQANRKRAKQFQRLTGSKPTSPIARLFRGQCAGAKKYSAPHHRRLVTNATLIGWTCPFGGNSETLSRH